MHQGKKTEISANQRGPWEGWFKHTKEDNYILYSSYKFLYTNTSEKPKGLSEMLAAAAAAKSLQSCPTPCNPIDSSPPGSPVPGFSRKNTGVGCHFLLQCMRVKSESEVAQSCPTLCDSMDYIAYQAPPSMEFPRQQYWSGLPFPSPINFGGMCYFQRNGRLC